VDVCAVEGLTRERPLEMTARRTRGLDTICEILIPFLLLYNLSQDVMRVTVTA